MTKKQLTPEEVKHLARLASLTLTDEEINLYQHQLSSIIDYITKLNELDTNEVEPTNQVAGTENVLRDDVVERARILSHKDATANKKEIKWGMFEVTAVFKDNE